MLKRGSRPRIWARVIPSVTGPSSRPVIRPLGRGHVAGSGVEGVPVGDVVFVLVVVVVGVGGGTAVTV